MSGKELMATTEMEQWKREVQQLQQENQELKKQLCSSKEHNKVLMDNLQQAAEEIIQRDDSINFLNRQVPALKRYLDEACTYRAGAEKQLQELQEELKRRDEEIGHLQSLLSKESKIPASSPHHCNAQELQVCEKSLQEEVRQLQALLKEQDKEINSGSSKMRMLSVVHQETLALLSQTEAARKESEEKHISLKEKFQKTLAVQEESHLEEFCEQEENFRKMLTKQFLEAKEELSGISAHWKETEQQWLQEKRALEETFQEREHVVMEQEAQMLQELEHLHEEIIQLQVSWPTYPSVIRSFT